MKKLILIILSITLMISLAARFWRLGQIPSILNRDEAALAYNAFLLGRVGVDEWGKSWPLILHSFGDDKLIGYPLHLIIAFKIFGENDWSVKLPSALAGMGLIFIGWLWSKRLQLSQSAIIFVVSSFATIPIFFFYGRTAFEALLALFYLLLGLYLLTSISSSNFWNLIKNGVGGNIFSFGSNFL